MAELAGAVSPVGAEEPRGPRDHPRERGGVAVVASLPVLVPAALAGFSVVAMVLLQAGLYVPWLVLPLGVAGAAAAALICGVRRPRLTAGPWWLDVLALLGAGLFAAVNLKYSGQDIVVFRDPATYAITGEWLAHHASLPVPLHMDLFGHVRGLSFYSAGFDPQSSPGHNASQFANLLPGLLGAAGWIGGDGLLLRLNPLIGGAAVLAFYGLVRQYAGRGWGLVATAVLALSLPMVAFSRASYSEPIAMVMLLGGLALLGEAFATGRTRTFALAGLVLGSVTLARIDGYFNLLALIVVVAAMLVFAPRAQRRATVRQAVALAVCAIAPMIVAQANLQSLSWKYFHDLGPELHLIALAAVALTLAAVIAVPLAWRTGALRWTVARTRGWLPAAAAGLLLLAVAVAASRPLWMTAHGKFQAQFTQYIAFLQRAGHRRVDPTRSYAEDSVRWLTWYYGIVTVVLGFLGMALLLRRLLRKGEMWLLGLVSMWLLTAALYLWSPSITPDQIWAMRRYIPIVIPGLLVGAAWVLARMAATRRVLAVLAGVLAAVMLVSTAWATKPLLRVRPGVPQLAEVHALCADLPSDAAVLVVDGIGQTYLQTLRSYCDVPAATLVGATPQALASVASAVASQGRRLYVLASARAGVAANATPVTCIRAVHWNARIESQAASWGADPRQFFIGTVSRDGQVGPIAPARRVQAC